MYKSLSLIFFFLLCCSLMGNVSSINQSPGINKEVIEWQNDLFTIFNQDVKKPTTFPIVKYDYLANEYELTVTVFSKNQKHESMYWHQNRDSLELIVLHMSLKDAMKNL